MLKVLKEAGVERQEAGGGNLSEDSDLSQILVAFIGEACTGLGGRDGGQNISASCLLPPNPVQASPINATRIWESSESSAKFPPPASCLSTPASFKYSPP